MNDARMSAVVAESIERTRRTLAVFGLNDKLVYARVRRTDRRNNQEVASVDLTDPNGMLLSELCARFNQLRSLVALPETNYVHTADAVIYDHRRSIPIGTALWAFGETQNPFAACCVYTYEGLFKALGWLIAISDPLPNALNIPNANQLRDAVKTIKSTPNAIIQDNDQFLDVLRRLFMNYQGRRPLPSTISSLIANQLRQRLSFWRNT